MPGATAQDDVRASYLVGEALALWRGEPLAEVADWAVARIEAERLAWASSRAEPSTVDQMPGVTFVRDDHEVLVTTPDGTVASWDIRPAVWIERACQLAGRNLTREEWRDYLPDRPYRETCAGVQPAAASDDRQR